MYWWLSYCWVNSGGEKMFDMMVFEGSFKDMILMAVEQPEHWTVLSYREINRCDYVLLDGEVG